MVNHVRHVIPYRRSRDPNLLKRTPVSFLPTSMRIDTQHDASETKTATGIATATALAATSECPPDSEQIGRSTWTFLHTTAAYYPVNPSPQHRRNMLSLLQSLPTLYPCGYCGEHLGVEMQKNPPDVSGREQLSKWLCNVHNEVNERLGKSQFDCSRVLERWKDGPKDGSCD